MAKRGYINVSVDTDVYIHEVIDEIDDDDLVDEIKERDLQSKLIDVVKPVIDYRSICDLLGVNYFTPLDELMEQLKQHLTKF